MLHSAFYRFTPLADPAAAADALRRCRQGLTGSIVVAPKASTAPSPAAPHDVAAFEAALQRDDVLSRPARHAVQAQRLHHRHPSAA